MRRRGPNEVLNWVVVVLAFAVPLYRAWVSLAGPLVLLLWFAQDRLGERLRRLRRHPLSLAVAAFIALNLVSLLWSSDPAEGLDYLLKYRYLLLIPAIASSLAPGFGGRALVALTTGAVISVLLMPVVIIADIHIRTIHPGNPAATMSHLDYSMVLAVAALLILIHLVVRTATWGARSAWVGALLVVLSGLVINIGRSGQFAFAVTLAVVLPLLLRQRSWPVRMAVLVGAVLALVGAYLGVPRLQARLDAAAGELYDAVVEHRVDSNQGKRVAGMIVGLDIVRDHPILGTGAGDNMTEFHRRLATDHPELREAVGWFPHLHNQYLQVATELGTVGLVSMLAIFAALIGGRYRHPESRVAAVAVACAYLVGFVADPFLHKQLPLVLFALTAGVISADDRVFHDPVDGGEEARIESS
ncbi:MAG: O-antigen ligase family protein [Thermoanaerobaculales bacterium]|jgi:O-antigen ligase|nr:O-antigen ligase family protein [Thermoanaerobaculales bacterium]